MALSRNTEYLLVGGATLALGALAVHYFAGSSSSGGAPLPPAKNPQTNDPTQLLAQAQALLLQTATNPNSVDPASLDTLASQLSAAGFPAQAAQVAAAANQLRAQRAGITPTTPIFIPATTPPVRTPAGGALPGGLLPQPQPQVPLPNLPGDLLPGGNPGAAPVPPVTPPAATANAPSVVAAQLLGGNNPVPPPQKAQILAALAPTTTFTSEQVAQLIAFMFSNFPGQTQLIGLLQQQQQILASKGQ